MRLKRFNNFIDIEGIVSEVPDSDIPSETNLIFKKGDYWIYVEGWCDRCFSNYDVQDRESAVELARELTEKRLSMVPNLPQYKKLRGLNLIESHFIELPENELNYAVSIGIYG